MLYKVVLLIVSIFIIATPLDNTNGCMQQHAQVTETRMVGGLFPKQQARPSLATVTASSSSIEHGFQQQGQTPPASSVKNDNPLVVQQVWYQAMRIALPSSDDKHSLRDYSRQSKVIEQAKTLTDIMREGEFFLTIIQCQFVRRL